MVKLQRCDAPPSNVQLTPNTTEEENKTEEGGRTPISHTLATAQPIETPYQLECELRQNEAKYRQYFKDDDCYVDFMMLPVPESKRLDLLSRMSEDIRAQRAMATREQAAPKASRRREDN